MRKRLFLVCLRGISRETAGFSFAYGESHEKRRVSRLFAGNLTRNGGFLICLRGISRETEGFSFACGESHEKWSISHLLWQDVIRYDDLRVCSLARVKANVQCGI